MTTTSEILNRAADLIEERGWTAVGGWIFDYSFADSNLCLEGGIQAAMGFRGVGRVERIQLRSCPAYVAMSSHINSELLYWWNDAKERTAPEVIEALRACAVIEASRERDSAGVLTP